MTAQTTRDPLFAGGMTTVALAAAVSSYSGLASLADLAGWNHRLALLLPLTIDAYALTATRVWLSPKTAGQRARRWAKGNAIGAIATSVAGNAVSHAAAAHVFSVAWPVVVAVSAIPSIVLGLITHLWHLRNTPDPVVPAAAQRFAGTVVDPVPEPVPTPQPEPAESAPEPVAEDTAQDQPKTTRRRPPARSRKPAKTTAPRRTEADLLAAASALNTEAIAQTGTPVSLRRLKAELRVGQPVAERLRAALAARSDVTPDIPASPVSEPVPAASVSAAPEPVEYANGTAVN